MKIKLQVIDDVAAGPFAPFEGASSYHVLWAWLVIQSAVQWRIFACVFMSRQLKIVKTAERMHIWPGPIFIGNTALWLI